MNKLLIACVFFYTITLPSLLSAQSADPDASYYRRAAAMVNDMKAFDKTTDQKNIHMFMLPYDAAIRKKTRVTVTETGNTVRKLTYLAYDESLTDPSNETYYFDPTGKLIGHINTATGTLSYDIYLDSVLVVFTKPNDPANTTIKGLGARFHQASDKYIVDYYLGAAGFTNYSTFVISRANSFSLRLLKDMPLHQSASPTSTVTEILKKGAKVYYLDRSPHLDSIPNVGKWIWYKVSTNKSAHTGWIWGYPSGVEEITDEE